jgi:tetratricopeptide (TPR) repeat protein
MTNQFSPQGGIEELDAKLESAEAFMLTGDYPSAKVIAEEVLNATEDLVLIQPSLSLQSKSLWVLGLCDTRTAHFNSALVHFNRSFNLAKNDSNISLQIRALNGIATVHLNLNNYQDGVEIGLRALRLAEDIKDIQQQAKSRLNIGNIYSFSSKHTAAIEHYSLGLSAAELVEDNQTACGLLNGMASVYGNIGDYSKSILCFERALSLAETIGAKSGIAVILCNIGRHHSIFGDYTRSLQYLHQALSMTKDSEERGTHQLILGNIGSTYLDSGEFQKAITYFDEALSHSQKIGLHVSTGHWMHGIARAQRKLGNLEDAQQGLLEVLNFRRETLRSNSDIANTLIDLGRIQIDSKKYEEGLILIDEAIEVAKTYDQRSLISDCYKEAANAYALVGNMDKAFEHLTNHIYQDQKIFNDDSRKNLENFNMRIAIENKERDAALAKKEMEVQQLRAEHSERELANSTLQLVAQNELLTGLRDDLLSVVRRFPMAEEATKILREKLKQLPCQAIDWKKFDEQFRAAHPDFVKALLEKYPKLTGAEVRICSLLRMNMKSDEIARLFCLSERSIESHRYNIRRKMGLKRDEELSVQMQKI